MKPKKRPGTLASIVGELRKIRIEKKLKREALAHDLGYHWMTIGRWERGDSIPSTAALMDWCQGLGVELKVVR